MTTMNISLPEALKTFVDEQVSQRGFGTSSEYVRELIRKDQDRMQLRGLLLAGADKVSINTAAIKNPELIKESALQFGSQCIVVAIDAKKTAENKWTVFTHGGREATNLDALEFAKLAQNNGAGEILLTSMDKDGTKSGYDIELTRAISESLIIPVIASGGVGTLEHIRDGIALGGASAVLAASIFHFGEYSIAEVKEYLKSQSVPVRI